MVAQIFNEFTNLIKDFNSNEDPLNLSKDNVNACGFSEYL